MLVWWSFFFPPSPAPPFFASFLFIYFKNIYFGSCRGLVAAHRIFGFGMWNLVPWPGVEPGPLHQEHKVPAVGPPGKSLFFFFKKKINEFILVGRLLYNTVVDFAIRQHESAMVHTSFFTIKCLFSKLPQPFHPLPFPPTHLPLASFITLCVDNGN